MLGCVALLQALPAAAQGSQRKPLIGYFSSGKRAVTADLLEAFQEGMHELGWREGDNIDIVYRFGEAQPERLTGLAEELIRMQPALILATAIEPAMVVHGLTTTIPIVSPALADAVHLGLVASMARPGGLVTGITPYIDQLPAKQLELAREIVPDAAVIGVLGNMNDPKAPPQLQELDAAARTVAARIVAKDVRHTEEIPEAIKFLADQGIHVLIVLQTSMLFSERGPIAALVAANRLPAVYGYRQHVMDGGLISYGADLRWSFHRAAFFVDKILHGAQPGDLPVEFAPKLELVINLRAAADLGLIVPPALLVRADEVIE